MTKEEIGELIAALPKGLDADEFIHRLVNWAVDLETERCAKRAENYAEIGRDIAREIRARGA
jgi:hypothetical protein